MSNADDLRVSTSRQDTSVSLMTRAITHDCDVTRSDAPRNILNSEGMAASHPAAGLCSLAGRNYSMPVHVVVGRAIPV